MRISQAREDGAVVLRLVGRLDRERADQLSAALAELLHDGVRSVVLDFERVNYVSSATASVVARWRDELGLLRGSLRLVSVTSTVNGMFAACGFSVASGRAPQNSGQLRLQQSSWYSRASWDTRTQYQTSSIEPGAVLHCRLHGGQRQGASMEPGPAPALAASPGGFGLGVGAIGESWDDGRERLGELLAVAGCIATFPTDGARLPDYVVGSEGVAPAAVLSVGLSCEGSFAKRVRFAELPEDGSAPLSDLAAFCLDAVEGDAAGLVVAAEASTLCGTRIRRSPAGRPMQFELPAVRDWLAYSPQQPHGVATALLAGVVARRPTSPLAHFLRPVSGDLHGHFHAAVFSYAPLPLRSVTLGELVRGLFERQTLRDVLHLLWDDRSEASVHESALVRGVGWVAPISEIS